MLEVGDTVEIRGERDDQTTEVFNADEDDATLATTETEVAASAGGAQ